VARRSEPKRDAWLEAARSKWPEIALDSDVFLAHVARHAAASEPSLIHAPDLYLACACARGVKKALAAFEPLLREAVAQAAVRRVDGSAAFADEVAQVVRVKLLTGERPKIDEYGGRSSLRTWVGVAAARSALNLRRNRDDRGADAGSSHVNDIADDHDGEIAHMKRRYGAVFEVALRGALERLDAEHRTLLRMHYCERASLERLAALHRVGRSTIARRIAAAKRVLLDDVSAELRAKLRLSDSEVASVTAFVLSVVDVSVTRLLTREI
jgi:RNA polymerase sigma-70 factor (ECF subfamily)